MVGWHHQLDGHEFEQALGVGDGQGSMACYSPWGHKDLDVTEQLNSVFTNLRTEKFLDCDLPTFLVKSQGGASKPGLL